MNLRKGFIRHFSRSIRLPHRKWLVRPARGVRLDCLQLEVRVVPAFLSVPKSFPEPQLAIDAAQPFGDTVMISEGTYEPFSISNKSITIQGAGPGTIIDAKGQHTTCTISNSSDVVIRDLETINGRGIGTNGGNFDIKGSTVICSGVTIANGKTPVLGAGAAVQGDAANVLFVNCTFKDNYAGAHEYISGAYDGDGGGLSVTNHATVTVTQDLFEGNVAWSSGGAIDCGAIYAGGYQQLAGGGNLKVLNSRFDANDGDYNGGISLRNDANVILDGNLFANQHGTYHGEACISMGSGTLVADHNTIVGTTGSSQECGAIDISDQANATVTNGIYENNVGYAIRGSSSVAASFNLTGGQPLDYTGGVQPGPGSIQGAALFIDAAHGDYHLQGNGPGVDAGTGPSDMGAYGGSFTSYVLAPYQQELQRWAVASANYVTSADANNSAAGLPHAWYATGVTHTWNPDRNDWVTLNRGAGGTTRLELGRRAPVYWCSATIRTPVALSIPITS